MLKLLAIVEAIGVVVIALVFGWVAAAVYAIGAFLLFFLAYGAYYALGDAHRSPLDSEADPPRVRTAGMGTFAFPRVIKPGRAPYDPDR